MGERVWLNQNAVPIPEHHALWAKILASIPAFGLVPLVWGLWELDIAWLLLGLVVVVVAKMWFLDRMVWLFDDMAKSHTEYAKWLR